MSLRGTYSIYLAMATLPCLDVCRPPCRHVLPHSLSTDLEPCCGRGISSVFCTIAAEIELPANHGVVSSSFLCRWRADHLTKGDLYALEETACTLGDWYLA